MGEALLTILVIAAVAGGTKVSLPLVVTVIFIAIVLLVVLLLLEYNLAVDSSKPDCECLTEPKPDECKNCTIEHPPHNGSDIIHDLCADYVGPNEWPGHDTDVLTPEGDFASYDSVSNGETVVWEVKTDLFPAWMRDSFVSLRVNNHLEKQARRQRRVADRCGFQFHYAVVDARHEKAILDHNDFSQLVHRLLHVPECIQAPQP